MTNLGIDQLAPHDGPSSGGSWKNHGESVSTVAFAAVDSCKSIEFVRAGFERRYKNLGAQHGAKPSIRIDIFLRDRHTTADTERAACHFESRRGLFPLVLV